MKWLFSDSYRHIAKPYWVWLSTIIIFLISIYKLTHAFEMISDRLELLYELALFFILITSLVLCIKQKNLGLIYLGFYIGLTSFWEFLLFFDPIQKSLFEVQQVKASLMGPPIYLIYFFLMYLFVKKKN